MTEPIRTCFAFNGDGLRCMVPAGHDGPHSHAIEWSDDEVWTPDHLSHGGTTFGNPHQMGVADGLLPNIMLTETVIPAGSGRCFCGHDMHDGMCGADDGDDMTCDCSNGIEV